MLPTLTNIYCTTVFLSQDTLMEDLKKRVRDLVRLMDADSDGYLDYYEAKIAFRALGLAVKKSFVVSVIRMYDKKGLQKISAEDFSYIAIEKLSKQSNLDKAKHAFKLFTLEAPNNKISMETLQKIKEKLDCDLTSEEMDHMIKQFDMNKDGFIDESEFIEMMIEPQ